MANHAPILTIGDYPVSKELLTDLTKLRPPYDDIDVHQDNFGKKLAHEWTLHKISDASAIGYDGALFSAEIDGKPHYFIYHQGTNNLKDLPSVARLYNGKEPQQMQEARKFTAQALEIIARNHPGETVPVAQVGYSLGGALAILSSDEKQPVIALDPPGTYSVLKAQGSDLQSIGNRVLEVLSPHPNHVNSHDRHIGTLLYAGEKFWKAPRASIKDFMDMAMQSHRLRSLGLGLASMDTFPTTPAAQSTHPQRVFEAFRTYMREYRSPFPTFDERFLSNASIVMGALRIDRLATKIAVTSADFIASRLAIRTNATKDQSPRLQTNPAVRDAMSREQAPEPEITLKPSLTLPEPNRPEFTERLSSTRQLTAQTSGRAF